MFELLQALGWSELYPDLRQLDLFSEEHRHRPLRGLDLQREHRRQTFRQPKGKFSCEVKRGPGVTYNLQSLKTYWNFGTFWKKNDDSLNLNKSGDVLIHFPKFFLKLKKFDIQKCLSNFLSFEPFSRCFFLFKTIQHSVYSRV